MADDKPSVLFASCDPDVDPDEIIRLVLRDSQSSSSSTSQPVAVQINEDIDAYPYHIDNKYYTTDVNLCSLKRKVIADETFARTVQGIVLRFDSSTSNCLSVLDGWLPYLEGYQAEIKILVCENCPEERNDGGCSRRRVQEWCIAKGFELVELEPDVDEDDFDEDFPETTGVKRIVQALNAHVWPNLVMKTSNANSVDGNSIDSELSSLANHLCLEEGLEESLEELMENDDFSELFVQLPELRARVISLQGPSRVSAAVQIVEAFWQALDYNRDEENILDL